MESAWRGMGLIRSCSRSGADTTRAGESGGNGVGILEETAHVRDFMGLERREENRVGGRAMTTLERWDSGGTRGRIQNLKHYTILYINIYGKVMHLAHSYLLFDHFSGFLVGDQLILTCYVEIRGL